MWKHFKVYQLSNTEFFKYLSTFLLGSESFHEQFSACVSQIKGGETARNLPRLGDLAPTLRTIAQLDLAGCKTVVIEENYIDRDFLSEHSVFYSKCFKQYTPRCLRMHFFDQEVDVKLGLSGYPKQAYMGFIVLRPTECNPLGRAMIRPFSQETETDIKICTATFTAHILGEDFTVDAMPFMQQDTQVGSCAHAALWMLARYLAKHFGFRDFSPAEINFLAKAHVQLGREYPADKDGLTIEQMLDALRGMGLSPMLYEKSALKDSKAFFETADGFNCPEDSNDNQKETEFYTKKLAEIAYWYIASNLPVIFNLGDHAIIGIGHNYDWSKNEANSTIDRISYFVIHDDGAAPYMKLPIAQSNLITNISFSHVKSIIVVTPKTATLCAEDAEAAACVAIQKFPDLVSNFSEVPMEPIGHLEFRTYLLSSVDFQQKLRTRAKAGMFSKEVADKLLALDYPRYLWVTDIVSGADLIHRRQADRLCLGMVITDSTAAKKAKGIISIHFQNWLVINDRQAKLNMFRERYPDSTPFKQFPVN